MWNHFKSFGKKNFFLFLTENSFQTVITAAHVLEKNIEAQPRKKGKKMYVIYIACCS
jgi:hypothetical protein